MATTYTGSIDLISGIRPKNGGSFPLVEASDVLYASGDVRLNTLLNGFTSETGSIKTYVDNAISAETYARSSADSTLSGRVTTLESAVGSGGTVDSKAAGDAVSEFYSDFMKQMIHIPQVSFIR